jgi:hypothetical protein
MWSTAKIIKVENAAGQMAYDVEYEETEGINKFDYNLPKNSIAPVEEFEDGGSDNDGDSYSGDGGNGNDNGNGDQTGGNQTGSPVKVAATRCWCSCRCPYHANYQNGLCFECDAESSPDCGH